jgi:urate oxidase
MLIESAYGKSRVRVVQLTRRDDRHRLCDLTVAIRFQGQYEESYTAGDNSGVLPTDTMKNTVYALAAAGEVAQPETFGLALARHFLARNPRLDRVRIDVTEKRWTPIPVRGENDPHAFVGEGPDTRTAQISASREDTRLSAGITDLFILKSSRSAFSGFVRDELTTLPDTDDRILATSLTATWRYRTTEVAFGPVWRLVKDTLLESFADHDSASVQHTMYAMGEAVLTQAADVTEIHLVMPNKHHLPVDLSRFGLENRNEIFVATDEPFGLIEATIARPRESF